MKRWIQSIHKNKRKLVAGILLILCMIGLFSDIYPAARESGESYKEKLIRFHVIANSDNPQDQLLKEKVRDRIIKEMNPKIAQSKSLEETRKILLNHMDEIRQIAEAEIRKNHREDPVAVSLGNFNFPTKTYGDITLPAGNYEALRVVIGEGEGSNWWCVLFPPLCFIDMEQGLTSKKTKEEMLSVLTEEEYNQIRTARSEDEVPIRLKFKVVELYEQAKLNVGKIVGKR